MHLCVFICVRTAGLPAALVVACIPAGPVAFVCCWGLVASQFGPEGTCELLTSGSGGHLLAAGDIHSVLGTLEDLVPCVKVGVSEHLWT